MNVRILVATLASALLACSPKASPSDAGASSPADAGWDAGVVDAGPGSGLDCSFNADCPASERCECSETAGCACHPGARGAGRLGLDTCTDGNDCATALCVEGWGGPFYCSGPCASSTECAGHLPLCSDIAFVGRICIRYPDGGS